MAITRPPSRGVPTRDQALDMARAVLAGKTRSYVAAATSLAEYLVASIDAPADPPPATPAPPSPAGVRSLADLQKELATAPPPKLSALPDPFAPPSYPVLVDEPTPPSPVLPTHGFQVPSPDRDATSTAYRTPLSPVHTRPFAWCWACRTPLAEEEALCEPGIGTRCLDRVACKARASALRVAGEIAMAREALREAPTIPAPASLAPGEHAIKLPPQARLSNMVPNPALRPSRPVEGMPSPTEPPAPPPDDVPLTPEVLASLASDPYVETPEPPSSSSLRTHPRMPAMQVDPALPHQRAPRPTMLFDFSPGGTPPLPPPSEPPPRYCPICDHDYCICPKRGNPG